MTDLTKMVRKLKWRNSYGVLRAETVFGDYKVLGRVLRLPSALQTEMVCESPEAAQAAANADHAARVVAALDAELLAEVVGLVRNRAYLAMTQEHAPDEMGMLNVSDLRFERDCMITEARAVLAKLGAV